MKLETPNGFSERPFRTQSRHSYSLPSLSTFVHELNAHVSYELCLKTHEASKKIRDVPLLPVLVLVYANNQRNVGSYLLAVVWMHPAFIFLTLDWARKSKEHVAFLVNLVRRQCEREREKEKDVGRGEDAWSRPERRRAVRREPLEQL